MSTDNVSTKTLADQADPVPPDEADETAEGLTVDDRPDEPADDPEPEGDE